MTANLHDIGGALLRLAHSRGATAADVVVMSGSSVSVDVRAGALEHAERAEGIDLGLRVFVDQKQASVSASDRSEKTMGEMVDRALAMAGEAPDDPYAGLAASELLAGEARALDLELADPTDEPSPAALERDARLAEEAALGVDGISQVQAAYAG